MKKSYTSELFNDAKKTIIKLVGIIGYLAIISLSSISIAFPLWYFSINAKTAYSISVLILFGFLFLIFGAYKLMKGFKESKTFFKDTILPFIIWLIDKSVILALLYIDLRLWESASFPEAIVLVIYIILLFIFLSYARKKYFQKK